LKNSLSDSRRLRVALEVTKLCIVVRDAATGKLGSVFIPLEEYFHSPQIRTIDPA